MLMTGTCNKRENMVKKGIHVHGKMVGLRVNHVGVAACIDISLPCT